MVDAVGAMGSRRGPVRGGAGWAMMAMAGLILTAGCQSERGTHPLERGYDNQGLTELFFYAPPGATVTVEGRQTRSHQIAAAGPTGDRLERTPEEVSIFNVPPGRHRFKYVTADGLPGVSVYGELNVEHANSHEARVFKRLGFIPISLPSAYYAKVEQVGDEIYPYRGEGMRRAIDELDLQRLMQGDVIEKVFFVADLEKAEDIRDETEQDIAAQERWIEYVSARLRNALLDSKLEITDPVANFFHTDRRHIKWERRRVEAYQDLDRLEALLERTEALLRGDRVLARKGMLVLATEEVIEPHRDPVKAADDLG